MEPYKIYPAQLIEAHEAGKSIVPSNPIPVPVQVFIWNREKKERSLDLVKEYGKYTKQQARIRFRFSFPGLHKDEFKAKSKDDCLYFTYEKNTWRLSNSNVALNTIGFQDSITLCFSLERIDQRETSISIGENGIVSVEFRTDYPEYRTEIQVEIK